MKLKAYLKARTPFVHKQTPCFLFSKAAARIRPNKICVFIDERHLPHECELKLVPLQERERVIYPGAQSQYRLKPVDVYESQVCINEEL